MEGGETTPLLGGGELTTVTRSVAAVRERRGGFATRVPGPVPVQAFPPSTVTAGPESNSVDDQSFHEFSPDDAAILQATTFLEDAVQYRSIHHRVDIKSLSLYRFYYSRPTQLALYFVISVLHILAFFEAPSSLTWTSDLRQKSHRVVLPCGVTETVELLCLLVLLVDLIAKCYFKGGAVHRHSPWLLAYGVVMTISLTDWLVSIVFLCTQAVKVRRLFRPFFLLQNSSLMKKAVKSLKLSLPQIASVLLLQALHILFFAIVGMIIFPKRSAIDEHSQFFSNLEKSIVNLLVLLTTANNPDVSIPAYSENRLYAIFFILFLVIGLYCMMSMLTAVIYNQFRGYFTDSLQQSVFRRRLGIRAAFEVLRERKLMSFRFQSSLGPVGQGVSTNAVRQVILRAKLDHSCKKAILMALSSGSPAILNCGQFQKLFDVLETSVEETRPVVRATNTRCSQLLQTICIHRYYTYFGCFITTLNVVCVTVGLDMQYDDVRRSKYAFILVSNMAFVAYYTIEQCLKVWAMGLARYFWHKTNVFEGVITTALVIVYILSVSLHGLPHISSHAGRLNGHHVLERVADVLILLRFLRVIGLFKNMFVVVSTLLDLLSHLRAFAGLMVVLFYSYALLGMELFRGVIVYPEPGNDTNHTWNYTCGSYEQLQYWANNFDDFAASLVVLWDVMVVNNWHVFLHVYSEHVNKWSQLYFIVWWLLSVVIGVNLFTALILENFIMRWDRMQQAHHSSADRHSLIESYRAENISLHQMFHESLLEPSEESLAFELRQHSYYTFSLCPASHE